MSNETVSHPLRTGTVLSILPELNQINPLRSYKITTQAGSVYTIRRNTNPNDKRERFSGEVDLLVSKDGAPEHPMRAQAIVEVGREWHIERGHVTSPITKIEAA